jgi:hypothetical protein
MFFNNEAPNLIPFHKFFFNANLHIYVEENKRLRKDMKIVKCFKMFKVQNFHELD